MQRTRSIAASDEWHLVGQSEDEGSVRSMSQAGASRPQTPAVSLHFEQHALELGSECPPTPESERLADTVLCAPFGGNGAREASPRPARAANSSVDACGAEVVSVRCLQGLSQEGSLEGFAGRSSAAASNTALTSEDQDNAAADKTAEAAAGVDEVLDESEITVCEELMAASVMEGEGADEEGWQGMDMAGVDAMVDFLESLQGWSGSLFVDACRASLSAAQEALTRIQQTTSRVASSARQTAHTQLNSVLAYVSQLQGDKPRPAPGLLVSALSLTTLATLAGLIYFMGRCRHLKLALDQRDKEYARLVSRVLNLQAALSQNMSTPGPVLRHTTTVLSSMVASSLV